jgi:hypothetical protein
MVLGMMQEMVDAIGDGWSFMLDRLRSYNEAILTNQYVVPEVKNATLIEALRYEDVQEHKNVLL